MKYLIISKSGYTLFSRTLGVVTLALLTLRIYKFLRNRKKEIVPEGHGYVLYMLKVAKGLLLDNYKPFENKIKSTVKKNTL